MVFAVGTYTAPAKPGLYVYRLDPYTLEMTQMNATAGIENPSYLSVSPDGRRLLVVSESTADSGKLITFGNNGPCLTLIDKVNFKGAGSCFVSTDEKCRHAFIPNYDGGTLVVVQLRNYEPALVLQYIQFHGTGPNKKRQEKSHTHAAMLSPDQKFLYCTDLGADRLYKYRYDPAGKLPLQPCDPPYIELPAGSGPRHFVFGNKGRCLYLLSELSGEIFTVSTEEEEGIIAQNRIVSDVYSGEIEAADIQIHPNGRFLYASSRGQANEIVAFTIRHDDNIEFLQRLSSEGTSPRNLLISPDGDILLAANEKSGNLTVFHIAADGTLTYTGAEEKINAPACMKWLTNSLSSDRRRN